MIGGIYFAGAVFAGALGVVGPLPAIDTTPGIIIGGVPVSGRVRLAGLTIRDILNDAPNVCQFRVDGDGPAVGQSVRIILGGRLLFSGAVQSVIESFSKRTDLVTWDVTAIDDTAEANARRPFGTWVDVSATTIALAITASFAPGFSPAGIAPGLPATRITFDGADTFIACLTRLATAVGGYCKVEDHTVYLFLEDTDAAPDPLTADTCFHFDPPIRATIDASQLRTRVYGKGYGESIQADVAAGETRLPIEDGAQFPPLGGQAIAGLTADGAQSTRISFTGVDLGGGGSLVGTGAGPTTPPALELQGGAGVTPGAHTVSVAFRTTTGVSLAGPPGAITTGTHPPPAAAPVAGVATPGPGPDEGAHEYAASFVTAYGETIPGPISNAIATLAASGQLTPPATAPTLGAPTAGLGADVGQHDYVTTFVTAEGETTQGLLTPPVTTSASAGQLPTPGAPPVPQFETLEGTGVDYPGQYDYVVTFTNANGETLPSARSNIVATRLVDGNPYHRINVLGIPTGPAGTTGRRLYRRAHQLGWPAAKLVLNITNNTSTAFVDSFPNASLGADEPTVNTTGAPAQRIPLTAIPLGPAGTTARRLYRRFNLAGPWKFVTTLSNNTATSFLDAVANSALGVDVPAANTTGTPVQRIPVTAIPLGPAGVTARKLYRRFNGAGPFRLVTTIANNTGTTFTDAVTNAGLGADAPIAPTAVGNQIRATIPIGAAAVTAREVYMSPVAGTARRLIAVLNDNATTLLTITASDATIAGGALEPPADTSGLRQPDGQVNPGVTVLPVAASGPFRPAGGWVTLGGQVVKYGGISGNTLTGIPPIGSGAITTAVVYGTQALPAPMLTGVTGLTHAMQKGAAVHVWIQRDDPQAQAEHAARTGGDGIVEFLIVDQRRGVESLAARCDADLAMFARPIVTVAYATRDTKTKSGKTITVNLASPRIVETLTIQDVTISGLGVSPDLPPRYTVTASNVRFSLEDTLRRLIAGGQVVGGSGT